MGLVTSIFPLLFGCSWRPHPWRLPSFGLCGLCPMASSSSAPLGSKVTNHLLIARTNKLPSVLISFDLSAALHTFLNPCYLKSCPPLHPCPCYLVLLLTYQSFSVSFTGTYSFPLVQDLILSSMPSLFTFSIWASVSRFFDHPIKLLLQAPHGFWENI